MLQSIFLRVIEVKWLAHLHTATKWWSWLFTLGPTHVRSWLFKHFCLFLCILVSLCCYITKYRINIPCMKWLGLEMFEISEFLDFWNICIDFSSTISRSFSWVLVAHACNPSYSGGRDQEAHGLKPAWANSSERLYLKNPFTLRWRP
jgi:hypothetical protein